MSAPANLSITLVGRLRGIRTSTLPFQAAFKILGAAAVRDSSDQTRLGVLRSSQQMRDLGRGPAQNDIIYAANPDRMPAGTTERLIDVHVSFPDAGNHGEDPRRSPTFLPATRSNNGTPERFELDRRIGSERIQIICNSNFATFFADIGPRTPTPNGFFGQLQSQHPCFGNRGFDWCNPSSIPETQTFVIRDITSASDVEITSADGKSTIYGLNAHATGRETFPLAPATTWSMRGPATTIWDGGTGKQHRLLQIFQ